MEWRKERSYLGDMFRFREVFGTFMEIIVTIAIENEAASLRALHTSVRINLPHRHREAGNDF